MFNFRFKNITHNIIIKLVTPLNQNQKRKYQSFPCWHKRSYVSLLDGHVEHFAIEALLC